MECPEQTLSDKVSKDDFGPLLDLTLQQETFAPSILWESVKCGFIMVFLPCINQLCKNLTLPLKLMWFTNLNLHSLQLPKYEPSFVFNTKLSLNGVKKEATIQCHMSEVVKYSFYWWQKTEIAGSEADIVSLLTVFLIMLVCCILMDINDMLNMSLISLQRKTFEMQIWILQSFCKLSNPAPQRLCMDHWEEECSEIFSFLSQIVSYLGSGTNFSRHYA